MAEVAGGMQWRIGGNGGGLMGMVEKGGRLERK